MQKRGKPEIVDAMELVARERRYREIGQLAFTSIPFGWKLYTPELSPLHDFQIQMSRACRALARLEFSMFIDGTDFSYDFFVKLTNMWIRIQTGVGPRLLTHVISSEITGSAERSETIR